MNNEILFLTDNPDLSRGSYRIWINDLNLYLRDGSISSVINDNPSKYDIIILDKNFANYYPTLKTQYPNKKIGIINLGRDSNLKPDFIIVGSIEEMDSLNHHKNVFLFPLIENMFQNCKQKLHKQDDVLKICYHGNIFHLNAFSLGLKTALEELDKEIPVYLKIITGSSNPNWIKGKPNINIQYIKYNLDTIGSDISDSDIGIVPNISYINESPNVDNNEGLLNTDYMVRFKNKSNAGRAFVFHQLGIPVVADLTPSNLHILGNPKNGFCVLSTNGWLKAFRKLKDYKVRQEIANNAKDEFDRLYDPIIWAKDLYEEIRKI